MVKRWAAGRKGTGKRPAKGWCERIFAIMEWALRRRNGRMSYCERGVCTGEGAIQRQAQEWSAGDEGQRQRREGTAVECQGFARDRSEVHPDPPLEYTPRTDHVMARGAGGKSAKIPPFFTRPPVWLGRA